MIFHTPSLAKGTLFGNLSFGKAGVCCLASYVEEMSNFGNSCVKTQNFGDFGLENAKFWQCSYRKHHSWHF